MDIIVGSSALYSHGVGRKPKDLDVWTDNPSCSISGDVKTLPSNILKLVEQSGGVASKDSLYTIKCSHLGWSNPMWQKHKQDVLFLESIGCKILPELFEALKEYWKTELGDKSFLSLDKSKEEFFTDEVKYIYDHDYLHELVAHPNKPMYTKTLKENSEVLIDKSKWSELSFEQQIRMFREEIAVIACERWVLNPYWEGKISWFKAHHLSLQKTITNLTKNWATDFIVLNLKEFVKPEFSYYENILKTLKEEK